MKPVGKQLQEARLAKNWTPELASRETKIKVDRLRDLEADNYSHFTSPAYARGFVRTYARFLGLDEYKILRQLDNKLPEDDSSNLATDSGVAYLPETSMPPRVAHRDYTGLYIVMALGGCVLFICAFVLYQAYRVGELPVYFTRNSSSSPEIPVGPPKTNMPPIASGVSPRALPVDPNETTNAPPKALPVDPSELANATNAAAPQNSVIPSNSPPRALPVDPSELTNGIPTPPLSGALPPAGQHPEVAGPPRALPVDPSELTGNPPNPAAMAASTNGVPQSPPVPKSSGPPVGDAPRSARQSNSGPVVRPSQPAPASPSDDAPVTGDPGGVPSNSVPTTGNGPAAAPPTAVSPPAVNANGVPLVMPGKHLVLTASKDSFVRISSLDSSEADRPLFAATLRTGQTIAFGGRKFSIDVGVPSAVEIKLDGVSQAPLGDRSRPETLTLESKQP